MAFRNLFVKTAQSGRIGSDKRPGEAGPADPLQSTDPATRATPRPEASDKVSIDSEQPTHIPHRGPAPFRPPPQERNPQRLQESVVAKSPPPVDRPATRPEPKQVRPAVNRSPEKSLQPGAQERRVEPREHKRGTPNAPRIPRHSSGWTALLKHLKEEPSLRVLDIGPTSPNNINFLTGMGHSVYLAEVVREAVNGSWELPEQTSGAATQYDVAGFLESNLSFGDRRFDVVLLWTTIDYLPDSLIAPLIARLHESMEPGGKLLAFFHTKSLESDTSFRRYHLVDSNEIDTQESDPYQVLRVYTNREIEGLFKAFTGYKFFLARDNVYEVIITR